MDKQHRHVMCFLFLLFFFFILLVAVDANKPTTKLRPFRPSPQCNQTEFELTGSSLMRSGKNKDKLPESVQMLKTYCKNTYQTFKKIEAFKAAKCYSDSLKAVLSLAVYSARVQMRRICSHPNSKRTRAFIAAGPCINQYDAKIDRCFDRLNARLSAIRRVAVSLKRGYLCCEYQVMLECFRQTFTGTECEQRAQASVEFLSNVMDNLVSSNCGEYSPDGDKCQTLAPLKVKTTAAPAVNVITNVAMLFEEINED